MPMLYQFLQALDNNKFGLLWLAGVTGEFRPKRVAAIMGPSGAGKTTFMNALCGRAYYGTAGG